MVLRLKDCVTLKNASRNGEVSLKNRNCYDKGTFGDRTSAYSGVKVQSRCYPGELVTRTGDREIRSVSGRLPDYPGELACMQLGETWASQTHANIIFG